MSDHVIDHYNHTGKPEEERYNKRSSPPSYYYIMFSLQRLIVIFSYERRFITQVLSKYLPQLVTNSTHYGKSCAYYMGCNIPRLRRKIICKSKIKTKGQFDSSNLTFDCHSLL